MSQKFSDENEEMSQRILSHKFINLKEHSVRKVAEHMCEINIPSTTLAIVERDLAWIVQAQGNVNFLETDNKLRKALELVKFERTTEE